MIACAVSPTGTPTPFRHTRWRDSRGDGRAALASVLLTLTACGAQGDPAVTSTPDFEALRVPFEAPGEAFQPLALDAASGAGDATIALLRDTSALESVERALEESRRILDDASPIDRAQRAPARSYTACPGHAQRSAGDGAYPNGYLSMTFQPDATSVDSYEARFVRCVGTAGDGLVIEICDASAELLVEAPLVADGRARRTLKLLLGRLERRKPERANDACGEGPQRSGEGAGSNAAALVSWQAPRPSPFQLEVSLPSTHAGEWGVVLVYSVRDLGTLDAKLVGIRAANGLWSCPDSWCERVAAR